MEGYFRLWYVGFVGLIFGPMLGVKVNGAPQVPCAFIFGDSLTDNGNNNNLQTFAKGNYFPYGIDFPEGTTGRFTNGKTIVDLIAEYLGYDHFIPPYTEAKDEDILTGVNYASASAGIREESGRELGERISFRGQVQNHKELVSRMVDLLGDEDTAANHLKKCIYSVAMGNNDYLNNYFLPVLYPTSRHYNPEQFADDLIDRYTQQIYLLYNYGARKFVLSGVGGIGCCPNMLARASLDGRTCVEPVNMAIRFFNAKLRSLVDRLNDNFSDAKFIYGNNYDILQDLLNDPSSYGLKVTNEGCCGIGRNHGTVTCLPGGKTCPNHDEYLFWDAYHPTQAANEVIAQRLYGSFSSRDVYPFNVSTLALL